MVICVSNISVKIWTHIWISEEQQSALVMRSLSEKNLRYNKVVLEFVRNLICCQQRGLIPLKLVDLVLLTYKLLTGLLSKYQSGQGLSCRK